MCVNLHYFSRYFFLRNFVEQKKDCKNASIEYVEPDFFKKQVWFSDKIRANNLSRRCVMKFIDYRSGETGGVGCGPICGPTFAEAMFYDNKGNSFFVLMSVLEEELEIALSDYSLFDILYNAFNDVGANFNVETEKAEKLMKSHHFVSTGEYYEEDLMSGIGKEFPDYLKAVNYAVDLFRREYHEEIDYDDIEELSETVVDDLFIPFTPFYPVEEDDEEE